MPQLGTGGGGKVKAIYERLRAYSSMPEYEPIVLSVRHNVFQKQVFDQIVTGRDLGKSIRHRTIYEAAHEFAPNHPIEAQDKWTDEWRGRSSLFKQADETETKDLTVEPSQPSYLEIRRLEGTEIGRTHYLDNKPFLDTTPLGDGRKLHCFLCDGQPIGAQLTHNGLFEFGYNFLTQQKIYREHVFLRSFMELAVQDDAITFIDGITVAYLAVTLKTPKVLFLHADHRIIGGEVNPRSKMLIERFNGDAIVTTTQRHRQLLFQDLQISKPIEVVPHYIDSFSKPGQRKNIITVSRLDLEGKPIDQSIRAFANIKDNFPDVNYLIYGDGAGSADLAALISELGCENRINLMGYTGAPMAEFSQAIMSVYPTMTEGFGLALLESLAAGCPVITFDVDFGPRELIQSGRNGELVKPNDIHGLEMAMTRVLEAPQKYQENTQIGLERYSYQSYVKNFDQLAKVVVGLHRLKNHEKYSKNEILVALNASYKLKSLFAENWEHVRQSKSLLDAYSRILAELDDVQELEIVLREMYKNFPESHFPLQRLMWITRKSNRMNECALFGDELREKFPERYQEFIQKFPFFAQL